MQVDNNHEHPEAPQGRQSTARRREILRRIGKASVVAGAAASPVAALAGGSTRRWCKDPIDTTKCVHATISGMGSVVLSAQASYEVCGKKCSYYSSYANWPSGCNNGTTGVVCNNSNDALNTKFCVAFNCSAGNPTDSNGVPLSNSNCLLNKSLPTLCKNYASTPEAHWATAFGNANKLASPPSGAAFPYTPAQVVGHFLDLGIKASAYTFYTTYCENYA